MITFLISIYRYIDIFVSVFQNEMESVSLEKLALIKLLTSHDVLDTHGIDIVNALSVDFISSNFNELLKLLEKKSDLYHLVLFEDKGFIKSFTIFKHIRAAKAKEYIIKKIQRNLKKYPGSQLHRFLMKKFDIEDSNNILPTITALSPTEFLDFCIGCIPLHEGDFGGDDIYVCKTQNDLDLYLLKINNDSTDIIFSNIDDQ